MIDHETRILVVEDDRGIQTLLKTVLTRQGYVVDCARDGREALHQFASGATFDVVLLDLAMPNVSGDDVLHVLERTDENVLERVIVITAASSRDASRLGALPVIRKPFDLDELVTAVQSKAAARA